MADDPRIPNDDGENSNEHDLLASAWPMPVEPINLLAFWPRPQPPTVGEIQSGMSRTLGADAKLTFTPRKNPDAPIRWSVIAESAALPGKAVVWCEPCRPMSAQDADALNIHGCRWLVGLEALLDRDDPHTHFLRLLGMLGRGIPNVPAIMNVNVGGMCYRQPELGSVILDPEIEPTADVLWVIHVLMQHTPPQPDDRGWLFTHGLWSCGMPELELMGVPGDLVHQAHQLLGDAAHLLLERGLPEPGEPWEIGPGLVVTLRPWLEVIDGLPNETYGSPATRNEVGEYAERGPRAVISAFDPSLPFATGGCPVELLQQLKSGKAMIFRTARWTDRQTRLAQRTWPALASAFARTANLKPAVSGISHTFGFLIKAGFIRTDAPMSDPNPDREHLWFEPLAFNGDRVQARLVHDPMTVTTIRANDVRWLDRGMISDWQVATPAGTFGPGMAEALLMAAEAAVAESVP